MKEKDLAKPIHFFKFIVKEDELPARLDSYLTQKMPWRSRTFFQKMIEKNEVEVNNSKCRSGRYLCDNDIVIVDVSSYQQEFVPPESVELNVIYEDNDLLVLNKTPDVIVHPTGRHLYNTLMNAVHAKYENEEYRPRLVHRLDKDTSGVLVLVKNDFSRTKLAQQIEGRLVKKIYLALAHGLPGNREGVIDLPIGQARYSNIRLKQEVSESGLQSKTEYKVLASAPYVNGFIDGLSLIKIRLITGRTHQIRLHLSSTGHPILADKLYGREYQCEINNIAVKTQMLHAWKFSCIHPRTDQEIEFTAGLPDFFRDSVNSLNFYI